MKIDILVVSTVHELMTKGPHTQNKCSRNANLLNGKLFLKSLQ